ncbi:MAG: TolC family outer membrane protein, partial [Gammaproteobacteria bacterium]|nr:TolC family outer membrane protein [Gammaproteobacteria bacterium]
MNRHWLTALVLSCAAGTAGAEDLQTVYQHALQADPTMRQAEMLHLATRETRTQAILNMLPLNAAASKNWVGVAGNSRSTPALANLNLQVNLFSWDSWIALKAASATVAQGEANYLAAREELISRVAQVYFGVLGAQDTLAAQESALRSVTRQLEQAERRYDVGLIAITDVQIAKAARDSGYAAVIAAKRALASAEEQLRAVTGEKYRQLSTPGDGMPLLAPDPASEDAWVTTALSQNANLIASHLSADIARDNYLTAIGGHLPQVNASASRTWDLSNSSNTTIVDPVTGLNTNTKDILWSVGVSVPLFSAGATQSRVRQAHYLWNASKSGYELALRQTEQLARDSYQGVISQIAQVGALKQAVESNQISLQATEAGYEVGTKTAVDVLTARQLLVQAQTNYAQAKYGYLNNLIALRLAAGNLDRATIAQINGWLVTPAPPAPESDPAGSPAPAAPA